MSSCPRCAAQFACANVDGAAGEVCWCVAMPVLSKEQLVVKEDGQLESCFCPACLEAMANLPHTSALPASKNPP